MIVFYLVVVSIHLLRSVAVIVVVINRPSISRLVPPAHLPAMSCERFSIRPYLSCADLSSDLVGSLLSLYQQSIYYLGYSCDYEYGSETVRYELAILRVVHRCTKAIRFLYLSYRKTSAQISLPYSSVEWVMLINSRRLLVVRPLTLAISRLLVGSVPGKSSSRSPRYIAEVVVDMIFISSVISSEDSYSTQ